MKTNIKTMARNARAINQFSFPINGWLKLAIRILAIMVSWFFNQSILWAIFHFFFGMWYLVYKLISGAFKDGGFMTIIHYYI